MHLCSVIILSLHRYVDIHYQLVPYLLSTGSNAYYNGKSSLTPLAAHQNFIDKVTKFMHMIILQLSLPF